MRRGEPTTSSIVDSFVGQIKAAWQTAVESIIETGRLLIEAKDGLPHGEFTTMVEDRLSIAADNYDESLPFVKRSVRERIKILKVAA